MRRLLVVLPLLLSLGPLGAVPASADEVRPRVTYGQDAQPGEYPWSVALVHTGLDAYRGQFCGGTLIAANVVLTAAHCTIGSAPGDFDVLAGRVRLLTEADVDPDRYAVESIAIHPAANVPEDGGAPRRDVSLVVLEEPVPGAKPLEIGTDDELDGGPFHVTGWGLDENEDYPDALQWASVDRVTDTACSAFHGADFSATDMMCALRDRNQGGAFDSCNGDSGGPLARQMVPTPNKANPDHWILVGAVSWGPSPCGVAGAPGVYARVTDDTSTAGGVTLRDWSDSLTDGVPGNEARPVLSGTGGTVKPGPAGVRAGQDITCTASGIVWSSGAEVVSDPTVTFLVREVVTGEMAGPAPYRVTSGDVGDSFYCEARATKAGIGGYGSRFSVPADDVTAGPAAATTTTPVQTVQEPVVVTPPFDPPPLPVVQPPFLELPRVVPPPADTARPSTRSVTRTCRGRVCTFTIRTADAVPSAGVTTVQATLTSLVRTRCGQRRRPCTKVRTRTLRAKRLDATTFTVRTARLPRGSHTLTVSAIDGAGNLQRTPRRTRFSVR